MDFGILYAILLTFWIKLYLLKAAILDAILNLTHSARDPDCPPKFFYLPRAALPGSRVKMRGHLIAHRTPLSPRTNNDITEVFYYSILYSMNRTGTASLTPPHPKVDGGPPSDYGPVSKLWVGGQLKLNLCNHQSLIIYDQSSVS